MRLNGRVAIITGAAGGIGGAVARRGTASWLSI
jgi:NAD(P)-dependent dehydrogenase (short-subunit alcohol dehydrogenase family)